jgi:hypothetical protein
MSGLGHCTVYCDLVNNLGLQINCLRVTKKQSEAEEEEQRIQRKQERLM